METPADGLGRRWAFRTALGIAALTCLPYLYDRTLQGIAPLYGLYTWCAYNVTDHAVYLSWMRQYADGAWTQRNLFTTLPQAGHQFNLFFLILGALSRWTGMPAIAVYHAARLASIPVCLMLVWRLGELLLSAPLQRRTAFLTVALSSGLGWIPGFWERGFAGPVDTWQPEAVTFLSLYLYPLFTVSLVLMLATLICLIEAERRRSFRHALGAGAFACILGNVHTYDIITLSAVWLAIVGVAGGARLRGGRCAPPFVPDRGTPLRMLAAGLPAALSSGHMFWIYRTEEVFARRVAVATLTPSLPWVLLGFGLLLPAAALACRAPRHPDAGPEAGVTAGGIGLLWAWAIVNIGVAYLPFAFQRKLLMGAHIPIAMLAGIGIASACDRWSGPRRRAVIALILLLLSGTNVRFMLRDRGALRYGGESVRAFMLRGERSALDWIAAHAPGEAVVQPLPWAAVGPDGRPGFVDTTVACLAPGITGRAVDAGHWGETPDFGASMNRWLRFLLPDTPDAWRKELLRSTRVRYLIFSQKREETRDEATAALLSASPMEAGVPYLRRIEEASSDDADVYEVRLSDDDL